MQVVLPQMKGYSNDQMEKRLVIIGLAVATFLAAAVGWAASHHELPARAAGILAIVLFLLLPIGTTYLLRKKRNPGNSQSQTEPSVRRSSLAQGMRIRGALCLLGGSGAVLFGLWSSSGRFMILAAAAAAICFGGWLLVVGERLGRGSS